MQSRDLLWLTVHVFHATAVMTVQLMDGNSLTRAIRFEPQHQHKFNLEPLGDDGALLVLLMDSEDSVTTGRTYYLLVQNSKRGSSFLAKCLPKHEVEDIFWNSIMRPESTTNVFLAPTHTRQYVIPGHHNRTCSFKMAFEMEGGDFSTWRARNVQYRFVVDAREGSIRIWVDEKLFEWQDNNPFPVVAYKLGTIGFNGKLYLSNVNSSLPQNTNFGGDNPSADAHTRLESEEEDEGEAEEGRDRFKTERTNIVSLKSGKSYGNIPDSLDNVIPVDEGASQKQVHKREGGQWRGSKGKGVHRGGMRPHFHQEPVFGAGGPRGPGFVRHQLHKQQHFQHQQEQPPPQQQQLQPKQQQQQNQKHQKLQQSLQQQLPQPPHKILTPHFGGAVQPHPACLAETYGEGCQKRCGKCHQKSCDPTLGHCLLGCQPGYYPPLCKNYSVYLYSEPEVTVLDSSTINVWTSLKRKFLRGKGKPIMYEIQYRKAANRKLAWLHTDLQYIEGNFINANVSGLAPSTKYSVRVVLVSDANTKCSKPKVGQRRILTKCKVPDKLQYELRAQVVENSTFQVWWHVAPTEGFSCSIKQWRLYLLESNSSRWELYSLGEKQYVDMADLPFNQKFSLKVQAVTIHDQELPESHEILLTTEQRAPGTVRNLQSERPLAREVQVSWKAPNMDADVTVHYYIQYQCLFMVGCQHEPCKDSNGRVAKFAQPVPDQTHRFLLSGLKPYAVYSITVLAMLLDIKGPPTTIKVMTLPSAPEFALDKATVVLQDCTKHNFTVHWSEPRSCRHMNGMYQGVHYELFLTGNRELVFEGDTYGLNHLSFNYLAANTTYLLRLHLIASGYWNASHYMEMNITTLTNVPRSHQSDAVCTKAC